MFPVSIHFKTKYIVWSLLFWLAGFLMTFWVYVPTRFTQIVRSPEHQKWESVSLFTIDNIFLLILSNNFAVAALLSFAGFFTGGFLTVAVSIWNGFFFGLICQVTFQNMPLTKMWVVLLYGPFELVAFFLFSAFGLEGIAQFQRVLKNQPVSFKISRDQVTRLWVPCVLLFIAAIIETIII